VLDAGPGGIRMYKLLVPESAVRGNVFERFNPGGQELFVSYLPVAKGYRRIGDEPAVEIDAGVFQLYPMISLLRHYRYFSPSGGVQSVTVPAGDFEATQYNGRLVMETEVYRSTNTCELFRSQEFPFGVPKWTATTMTETKGSTDVRSEFQESVTIQEEMQAVSIGSDAESEFLVD
jgi:hypothetical protein